MPVCLLGVALRGLLGVALRGLQYAMLGVALRGLQYMLCFIEVLQCLLTVEGAHYNVCTVGCAYGPDRVSE